MVVSVVVDVTEVKLATIEMVDIMVLPWELLVAMDSVKGRERRGVHAF